MSNQWISIDDRKPAIKDYCLTLGSNDDVEFAVYTQDRDGNYFASIESPICDKFGYDNNGLYGEIINVKYWFPLPQLPNLDDN